MFEGFKRSVKRITKDVLGSAEQLTELTESVKFINEKFDKYEQERNKKDVIIEELKKENANLKEHLKDVEQNMDRQTIF